MKLQELTKKMRGYDPSRSTEVMQDYQQSCWNVLGKSYSDKEYDEELPLWFEREWVDSTVGRNPNYDTQSGHRLTGCGNRSYIDYLNLLKHK